MFLHVAIQFPQHHFLNRLLFPPCIFLPLLLQSNYTYKYESNSGLSLLFYFCANVIVLITLAFQYSLESGNVVAWYIKTVLAIGVPFVFLCKFQDYLFLVLRKILLVFDRDYSECVDCLGKYGHINKTNYSDQGAFLVSFLFQQCIIVFSVQIFYPLVKFIPGNFILLDAILSGIVFLTSDLKSVFLFLEIRFLYSNFTFYTQ